MKEVQVLGALKSGETEREELELQEKEARDVLEGFRSFEILSDEDYQFVGETLREVKGVYKQIEERRKKVTAPLNEALKEFRAWYQPALAVLENTEALLKRKLADYDTAQRERARLAMEAAAEASRQGDFDAAHAASQGIVSAPQAKGITVTRRWDYRLVDLSLVPREFLCLDHSAVKIYLKAAGKDTPTQIPGLEFFETESVTARS